jgi:hypothetical protein
MMTVQIHSTSVPAPRKSYRCYHSWGNNCILMENKMVTIF